MSKNKKFTLLSEYKSLLESVKVKCNRCLKEISIKSRLALKASHCASCDNPNNKFDLDYVKKYCANNGFIYIDDYFKNSNESHNFICSKGHNFTASFAKIKTYVEEKRAGCLSCFNESRKSDINKIAIKCQELGFTHRFQ